MYIKKFYCMLIYDNDDDELVGISGFLMHSDSY